MKKYSSPWGGCKTPLSLQSSTNVILQNLVIVSELETSDVRIQLVGCGGQYRYFFKDNNMMDVASDSPPMFFSDHGESLVLRNTPYIGITIQMVPYCPTQSVTIWKDKEKLFTLLPNELEENLYFTIHSNGSVSANEFDPNLSINGRHDF